MGSGLAAWETVCVLGLSEGGVRAVRGGSGRGWAETELSEVIRLRLGSGAGRNLFRRLVFVLTTGDMLVAMAANGKKG